MQGKVVLITGGGSGIGAAAARRFVSLGATVAVAGRREQLLQELAQETGAWACQCDVADTESVKSMMKKLTDEAGRLDVVVNNAAITERGSVHGTDDDSWNRVIDVNLNGAFRVGREAVPHLRRSGGGAIVNVSSIGGHFAAHDSAAYGTTKAAIMGLTRSMARDYGSDNIRVNTLCPGWVDTPMADPAVELLMNAHGVSREEATRLLVRFNPIARMATPDEIARCIEFLATDASACVTGTVLMADNGQSIVDVGFIPFQLL